MRNLLLLSALAFAAAPAATAQTEPKAPPPSPHFYGTLGYSFEEPDGFELALGLQADWEHRIYVRASPLNVLLYDAPGFYMDQFSNGQSRCRDESNGQFATDASCTALDWRGDADIYVRLNNNVLIGGGGIYMFDSEYFEEREGEFNGFAAVMLEFNERLGVEVRGGSDYAALRLRASF